MNSGVTRGVMTATNRRWVGEMQSLITWLRGNSVQMTRLCHTANFRDPRQQPAPKSTWYSCLCLGWEAQVKDNGKAAFLESKPSPVNSTGPGHGDAPVGWCQPQDLQCCSALHHVGCTGEAWGPSRRDLLGRIVNGTVKGRRFRSISPIKEGKRFSQAAPTLWLMPPCNIQPWTVADLPLETSRARRRKEEALSQRMPTQPWGCSGLGSSGVLEEQSIAQLGAACCAAGTYPAPPLVTHCCRTKRWMQPFLFARRGVVNQPFLALILEETIGARPQDV